MRKIHFFFLPLLGLASSGIAAESFLETELNAKFVPQPIPNLDINAPPQPIDLSAPPCIPGC